MTSADSNYDDLVPAQEKLEWVTPQISPWGLVNTEGFTKEQLRPKEFENEETTGAITFFPQTRGPS